MTHMLALSHLESNTDRHPRAVLMTWEQLTKQLSVPLIAHCTAHDCIGADCPYKKNGPAWMPASYAPGATRHKVNVQSVSALVIDIDHLTDAEFAAAMPRYAPFRYIAHASHSDSPRPPRNVGTPDKPKLVDGRCIRVVIALSRPVLRDEWPRFWVTATQMFGGNADPSTCDASRLYYKPLRPHGANYYFHAQDGALLDVDGVLAHAPPAPPEPIAEHVAPVLGGGLRASPEGVHRAVLALAAAWPSSQRHKAQLCLAGALASEGLEEEQITEICAAVARSEPGRPAGYDGYENGKRAQAARDSVAKVESGSRVAAWGALAGFVGQDVIERVEQHLGVYEGVRETQAAYSEHAPPKVEPQTVRSTVEALALRTDIPRPAIGDFLCEIAATPRKPLRVYSTGIPELDKLLGGGLRTRQIAALLAPPGSGKSALCAQIALTLQAQIPVLIVSTELESEELLARYGSNLADLTWRDEILGGDNAHPDVIASAVQNQRIVCIGCEKLPREPLGSGGSIELILLWCAWLEATYGVTPAVLIDFVQDMVDANAENLRTLIGSLARNLLTVSQSADCTILMVGSVARTWYSPKKADELRETGDPTAYISAAKEAGGIDFVCATVLFLDVDNTQGNATDGKPGRVAVAKCRHGETGFAGVRFHGRSGRFVPDAAAVEAVKEGVQERAVSPARVMKSMAKQAMTLTDDAGDDARVIGAARDHPQPKTNLREICGIAVRRADAAIMRCLADKRLILRQDEYINGVGQLQRRTVIAVPGTPSPPVGPVVAPAPPLIPNTHLAEFMRGMQSQP